MRLNLPWWINPWAEVRRQRDEAFARGLSHGSEVRGLRAEVEKHKALADKAVDGLFEVQSYAATQLRALRFEVAHARQREKLWQEKVMEMASLMPPPIQFVRKDSVDG